MMLYVVITPNRNKAYETHEYLDAVHYQTLHPECVILKFYVLGE